MSVIVFPNLEALRSALASKAVPLAVSHASARAGVDADGRVWLQPAAAISARSAAAIARFGATIQPPSEIELTEEIGSWPQLIPLVPAAVDPDNRPSPVLFDLPDAADLPTFIAEVRRLGAGTIQWRSTVSPRGERSELSARAQLQVESPPYHSLLCAIPRAYAEQSPGVWVEVGWRHPLAEIIVPPVNHIVLVAAPRTWELVPDDPFQSGPVSFPLSERSVPTDAGADLRLPVAVRLVAGRTDDPPELWVLQDRPLDQLHALVQQTDDRLLARLNVAVGTANGRQIAVLRARPGRGVPPVLVLDALACRPYLRLPNLYLPVGQRLRPPLRRDAVRQLFANDAGAVFWLEPGEFGSFAVHSIPEAAFRPLAEAIDYVQDHAKASLTPWVAGGLFALPPFVVQDLVAPPARRQPARPAAEPLAPTPEPVVEQPGILSRIVQWFTPRSGETPVRPPTEVPPIDKPPRSLDAGEAQRRVLEERLLVALNTPDGPDRAALWPELGRLYAVLNRPGDAAICWLNALWETEPPPPLWSRGWLRAEARAARGTGSEVDLRRWLTDPPMPAAVRAIAAAVGQRSPPVAVVESLAQVQRLLDEHEDWLPVRAAWLAQLGLIRLNGGDVVGLARARDRMLDRLHQRGLSADLDIPAAVRFAGQGAGERVDAVRAWLIRARTPIHRWLDARPAEASGEGMSSQDPRLQAFGMGTAAGPTRAYADLILAWSLARLGERGAPQKLLTEARGVLGPLDAAQNFLLDAFTTRIAEALEGRIRGPLPADLLARLASLREQDQLLVFKADRLRQFSRVLEPTEQVWAFNESWLDPQADGPTRDLAGLRYVTDRDELADRLLPLVASADAERLPSILAVAMDLAPRLGETRAGGILERLLEAVGDWSFAGPPARIAAEVTAVERGLFVAAHFDRAPAVQSLLAHLGRLLDARRGGVAGESQPVEDALLTLVGQGLRSLRRLGLRLEADRLLDRLGEWVAPSGSAAAERRRQRAWPLTLRRLLTLAGGWFYVGRDAAATEVLDEARRLLFSSALTREPYRRQQTELACAYAAALGHAPVRLALNGVEELFTRLPALSDSLVTNTHYSLAKLRLVEAAVRSVVTDDFALGPAVRRWLDDDEYRVRRRIHRDTRALIGAGE
jgi:hypothetical protein